MHGFAAKVNYDIVNEFQKHTTESHKKRKKENPQIFHANSVELTHLICGALNFLQ